MFMSITFDVTSKSAAGVWFLYCVLCVWFLCCVCGFCGMWGVCVKRKLNNSQRLSLGKYKTAELIDRKEDPY